MGLKKYILAFFLTGLFKLSYATTYTMGTSGSQSATISATLDSPDYFYDNGGSGSNYSNNTNATYTFDCTTGKYVRIKFTYRSTESSNDLIKVFDGNSTAARLIGKYALSGTSGTDFLCVGTSGSLTVQFTSNSSTTASGWVAELWVGDYPGQLWDGSSSTNATTATNWEGDATPYNGYSSIYIPSGLTNYPIVGNSSSDLEPFDTRIASGATLTYSATNNNSFAIFWGDFINEGTYNRTGNHVHYLLGGLSSSYASLGGAGTFSNASFTLGEENYDENAYYKLTSSTIVLKSLRFEATTTGAFDMNDHDLSVTSIFQHNSSYLFYQRTGTLSLECAIGSLTIDDAQFQEGTGTTYFSSGTISSAIAQTVPTVTYYNLKIRTNNGYTATIGSTGTVSVNNDLTIINPSTAGGNATTAYNVTVGNNFYLGNSGNALVLNLANRIYRVSGTGIFTMGNLSDHAVNITYADPVEFAMAGFGNPTFYGTVTYNSSSQQEVMDATFYHLTITGSGTRNIENNNYITGNFANSGTVVLLANSLMECSGNWTNTGTFIPASTSWVKFVGTSSQLVTSGASVFENLEVNNSSTGIVLQDEMKIGKEMKFMDGIVQNSSSQLLIFDEDAVVASSPSPSATSHVNGYVRKLTNTTNAFVFPVGDGSKYKWFSVTPTGTGVTTWTVSFINLPHPDSDLEAEDPGLLWISDQEYWICDRSGASAVSAILAAPWEADDVYSDWTKLGFGHYDGTTDWNLIESTPIGDANSGILTSNVAVSDFSPFAIGEWGAIALPLEIISFTANKIQEMNQLTWKTASETGVQKFELEKSEDGIHFRKIGEVLAKGNSYVLNEYDFDDHNISPVLNYYRLKEIDMNGFFRFSSILTLDNRLNILQNGMNRTNLAGQKIGEDFKGWILVYDEKGNYKMTYSE